MSGYWDRYCTWTRDRDKGKGREDYSTLRRGRENITYCRLHRWDLVCPS